MEGQHIQENVPMSEPLEHEGAGDTPVMATVLEASLEWDAYADGGYDLLRENNSHGFAWMQFPNIHRMQPANCGNYSGVSPFSTTWIEHTSKIWKSSYPYTFYRTSFDDDFEDYKSCESEDDFYSCDSNESDVEELQISFRETSQVNLNIDTLTIQLKFTVSSVSLTKTNKTRSQAKITETTNFKDNNVFPQENAEISAEKCSYYDEIRLNEASTSTYNASTSDSQLFTECAEFDEQMNDNDDKELEPLVQPTSCYSNHGIQRLLDPLENAANVYNNYHLISISPSGSDTDIDEPHFIVLCPNSNGNFVEDGEFILSEEYYEDSFVSFNELQNDVSSRTENINYKEVERRLTGNHREYNVDATQTCMYGFIGKTKDDENILCNLKDDYVNRTLSSVSSPRSSSDGSACSSDTIQCNEVNSIRSMEDTELQDQLLTKPLDWKYNPIFIPKKVMNRKNGKEASSGGMEMNAYPDVVMNKDSGDQNSLYKIVTENNQHIIVSPHSTDQNERNTADIGFRKLQEGLAVNEESFPSSHKEKTTFTSDQSSENEFESDSSFYSSSASSSVENTQMHEKGRSNEFAIHNSECGKMDITAQAEIISDNDFLPENDFPSLEIKVIDSMKSIVSYGITNASDMTQDTIQMPADLTDEDDGKTIDDENILCNLKDDYVNRTLSYVSSPRPSSDVNACSSDTMQCDEVNSIRSKEDTELHDQLLTKPLEWKYNPIFIPKNGMNSKIEKEVSLGGMEMNAYPDVLTNNGSGGQNTVYKIDTENNQRMIVSPYSTDQKESNPADISFRSISEEHEQNEESFSSSQKEKRTITSDQSSENVSESDNSFFSSSESSSVENTQMQENGRSNEFTIDYPECSKSDISDELEMIGDNDLLPEKDYSIMKINSADSVESVVGRGIIDASDYLDFDKRFVSRSPRPSSDGSAYSSDTIQCDEVNSIRSKEYTELQDQLLTKPLEWKYNPIFIPKKAMNSKIEKEASSVAMVMNAYPDVLTNNCSDGQNNLYKIITENNQHIIESPHLSDQKESIKVDIGIRKHPEEPEENEESPSSSHKEKTKSTSDQSSENISESDNSLLTSSASSTVENTPVQENGRSNKFTIDYPECSKSDISEQWEIIGDNDLLPEKDFPSTKIKFFDSKKFVVAHEITNASDITQDAIQMPDDLTDEDEGQTKDDEQMLCNLIDDYVTTTILSIRDELYQEVKDMETEYHHMQYKQPSNKKQTKILEEKLPKELNVEIPSPESKSNVLETNNSLKHDKISEQLFVDEESLYHKHDTENKPNESFNVLSNLTETTVKPKVMSESDMDDTDDGEYEESDALGYKEYPSEYLDFEKGFASNSSRPSSDESACSSDIVQCDEVNSIPSMEDTEFQDELLTKPLEWNYNPIYPKKAMTSKIEKQASFEMIYPDVLTNNGSGGQISLYKIDTENDEHIIVSPHSTDQKERSPAYISFRKIPEELEENDGSSSSSHKEKTTSTSDPSLENVSESDNSLFTSSASSSAENTPVQENGRSNEFTIDYPECSKSDISDQSEIISDNDLLPEKDYSTMKINSADSVESVVAHGITNASDMRQDTLEMPDDLTDENEGQTKDDEKILCNLIDDYVTRTILSIRDELYREVKDVETEYHEMQYKQPSNNKQTKILEEKLPRQLNVEIPSPKRKCNTLETNNSLKHDRIKLFVEGESLYHKHDTENKPNESFNVLSNQTETTVKPKVMSESDMDDTDDGEDEESDALRYKEYPSEYLDFEKGFASNSSRPSSDESACSSDIVQCDEVNSIPSMEDTEFQDELLTKPLEWNYNPIYPKKAMTSKIEKQASFEMIYPDVLTNNGSGGQISLYKIDTENDEHIIVSPHSTDQKERSPAYISFRKIPEELEENDGSSSSSHKEKTTSTSDPSLENVSESDNSLFTSSASSSAENTPVQENGRLNEFTIDYPECSKSDISDQSEIISDNDLLPEKDYSTMKINSADSVESVVAHGITNASDMRQDTLEMPDDLTDENEGQTKDDEKILCNLIDDYVTRTILSIRDELYREVKDMETEYHEMQYKQPSNNKQTKILEEKLPRQLNVEIPSPKRKCNTLETNNSLKHDRIKLFVEGESLYHKHDTENKPNESFNVLSNQTETTVKPKVMSESDMDDTDDGEDEESDALRYKEYPSEYLDFEKGFVSNSPRPSSDGSACSSDIVQSDEVNFICSMEDTELQEELLTKPLEWNNNPIYPKKAMTSKIEKQASFEMIYSDVLTNNGSGGQNSLYKIDTENNQHIIVSPHSTDQKERSPADKSFRKIPEEMEENDESSSSSHKEKTTSTSDQSSENISESDNSLFTSSASLSVENTPVQENGRSNEFTIDYPECSNSDISEQSEIIGDNDLLPEKDFPSMKIKFFDSKKFVVAHEITNASDMIQDAIQMPDDLPDEDEGQTKDNEQILCNLIDDYVTTTILSIRNELYREAKDMETEYHHMQYKQPSNNKQAKILEEKLPKQLNVEIPSPDRKSNILESNNSLKHDRIQLFVEEESLYHKHDTENKPYESFNVVSNQTETTVKPKVMSESDMNDTDDGEDGESDALRYKEYSSDYLDFEKGFVSNSPRPSFDGNACSSDIVQSDEVNFIRSMEDTELQEELLTKPLEWNNNPIYPKKAMTSKIEKQASFEMIYSDVLTNNGSGGQNSLYKKDTEDNLYKIITENNQHIIVSPHSTNQKARISADISFRKIPEELDENAESSSSSNKKKTTSTSDESSENVSESDNSFFSSSASSSVENTSVQENGKSNEFIIDYTECSKSDISDQSEIISNNDLLPEKDFPSMKIISANSAESVAAYVITNASDMRQDTLQMPDDLTDEDEGQTKDDEKILCSLIDDIVTGTILSIRDELYREVKDIETEYYDMQYKQPSNNKQTKILEEKLPKQLNVEIPSPERKRNTLETNNSLKHDKISQQLFVEEESLYHKHDTENKPYESVNVLLNQTETTVKPKVMSESDMDDTDDGEDEESDALRYKDNPSDCLDFEKGFVTNSSRPSSDGSACSSDIIQCDEVNSIRSMEDTELQDGLITKPLEWNYNPIYPKKVMNSKTEKEASFDQECPQSIDGIECHLEFNPDTVKYDKYYTQIVNQEDERNLNRIGVKYIDRKEYKIELANDRDTIRLDKECKHAIEQERKHGLNGTDMVLYLDPMRFDQKCKHTADVEPHRSSNDTTPTVDWSHADWHDTKADTASTKPLESKFNPTYIPKNALNFSKMSDNSLSKIPVYERCNSHTGSSSISSSNTGVKVADLAKKFSSSQLDTRNSVRGNRNYCEELDVSVSEILKTFDDSSDINISKERQMPVRQKGKQMKWKLNPVCIPKNAISSQIEKEASFDSMVANAYDVLTNNSSGGQNRIMDDASLDILVHEVMASKTYIYPGNNNINDDPSFDNLVMKCDPDCTQLQKADKRGAIKNTLNVSKMSENSLSKIPVYERCNSRTGSSNTEVKVADLAKMFSSSKLDTRNSVRGNRNACKELDVSVSEISKTFVASSDINTSNVRQMPVRQKGKQMYSTSPDRVTKGEIYVKDEGNIANNNQDAIVENVSNKHDETNVESKGNEVENSSFQSLNTDVDSIYTRYTSKDDKGYLATFLKRKNYSPVKLKYLHESKPAKIDHNKLRTIIKSLDQPQRPYSEEIEKRKMFSEADPNPTCMSDHPANVEESQKNLPSGNKKCSRHAIKDDDDDDGDDDDDDELSRFEY